MNIQKIGSCVLSLVMLLSVAACGNTTTEDASSSEAVSGDTSATSTATTVTQEYPIVIEHAFGTTTIEKKPERIATVGWANQDTPLALDVMPVGFSMANFGPVDSKGMHPWTAAKVAELGVTDPNVFQDTDGFDYEAISDCQPDVILAAYSGMTEEEYNLLSQIAPVVAYPTEAWQTSWRDQILINSKAMGMEKEGEDYVSAMNTLIETTTSQYPELEGKTGAFLWISPTDLSKFYLYFPVDPRAAYLEDMGVAFPEELTETLKEETTGFSATISAENVDVLNDLDILVAYGDDMLLETLQNDSKFGTVPAIQRGSVVFVESSSDLAAASTPSALSIPSSVEEYAELLGQAAAKV